MKLISTSILVAFFISGCNLYEIRKVNTEIEKSAADWKQLADKAQQGKTVSARKPSPVDRVGGLWLPSKKLLSDDAKTRNNQALTRKITVNRSFINIEDMAERITILTGIPVTISPEAAGASGTSRGGVGGSMGGAGIVPSLSGLPTTPGAPINPNIGMMGGVNLVYNGTLAGFLDVAAARYGVYWEWKDSAIRLFRVTSRTFRLSALPGDTMLNATVSAQSNQSSGGGGAGGGSSGGSPNQQESGVSFSGLSVWKSIEDSVRTMLTSMGKVIVTPATGTISVTDTPQVLSQVEKLIEQQNRALSRQVAINVRVLAVELTNKDQFGINWDAIYKNVASNIGFEFYGVTANVIEGGMGLTLSAADSGNSHLSSASAFITALSEQGRVTQVTSASLTTLNNQPAPLQVGKQTSYLASSSSSTAGASGNITTTLQPGVVTTGFSMNLVPHILDDERLLLQYAVNLSELKNSADGKMPEFSSGSGLNASKIQVPEVNTRNFLQRVVLNSGDMMAVAGFEQTGMNGVMEGVGNPENLALGGNRSNSKGRVIVVVLLQPVLAN